ncbi:MAG: hypothetical protein CFE38_07385 [Comamonadaceae bacterium PBBC1]|nr:MAG: hypothetical protein CFE38_07385 [Comamonadaceae bacterium PBBC1]
MKRNPKAAGKQRGFTLVEMSVTMAAAGLLFAAVTTGQELIDQAKATKLINDVKTVEMQIQQYAQIKGRMPGDCNADGEIDFFADDVTRLDTDNTTRAQYYSYSVLQPTIPALGAPADLEKDGCARYGSGSVASVTPNVTNANVWLNDLKLAGVISDSVPNRNAAKLVNEDFMFVGTVQDNEGESAQAARYNAIVIHNVPQWMALRLAKAVNGQDGKADRSRVRLLNRASTDGTYEAVWETNANGTGTTATRDNMVSVVYFFDRVPESKSV